MEKKNDKKFNWKKAAVIGGIFAAGVAVGVAGDKVYIKMLIEKGYKTILKEYRLHVDPAVTDKGVKKVFISITDKLTGKTFGTTWKPETAIWLEERGLWSIDEQDALQLIDHELDIYTNEHKEHLDNYRVLHMWDAESGMIDNWHKYCQRQMRDNYHTLDEQLIFANTPVKKESYASKRLPYVLEPGNIDAYDELMQTLYSPEEREKIEWCIGSIVNGDSKTIQKFMVLYGPPGSGKSTVLNIIQKLFTGYYAAFDSQALGSASNAFSLEAFKANPLIAIQHEGNLSKIEDNTRLNSLVSHETMMVNEKFRSAYANQFKSFLILATNKPVKITDAKSGLIRRLIDVVPTGEKVPQKRYSELYAKTDFELGGIAWHCKEVYEGNKHRYDDYIPTRMLGASNDFYNFMLDRYYIFKKEDGISLKRAWAMYDEYNQRAKVVYTKLSYCPICKKTVPHGIVEEMKPDE